MKNAKKIILDLSKAFENEFKKRTLVESYGSNENEERFKIDINEKYVSRLIIRPNSNGFVCEKFLTLIKRGEILERGEENVYSINLAVTGLSYLLFLVEKIPQKLGIKGVYIHEDGIDFKDTNPKHVVSYVDIITTLFDIPKIDENYFIDVNDNYNLFRFKTSKLLEALSKLELESLLELEDFPFPGFYYLIDFKKNSFECTKTYSYYFDAFREGGRFELVFTQENGSSLYLFEKKIKYKMKTSNRTDFETVYKETKQFLEGIKKRAKIFRLLNHYQSKR